MLLVYLLLTGSLALTGALGQQQEDDLAQRVAEVRAITGRLLLKQLVGPDDKLLEPTKTLEMLKRCKQLMPNGIRQVEGLSSDQTLVDWWLNLEHYIEISVLKPAKWCKDGSWILYMVRFVNRRYPNMAHYADHYRRIQDGQCKG